MEIKGPLGKIWIRANSIWAYAHSHHLTTYTTRWTTIDIKDIKRKANESS